MIPYARQSISDDDVQAVAEALKGDIITRGEKVQAFEKAIADYVGAEYAVAFSSGSAALNAAYIAYHVGPSDCILTSPNTFIATLAFATQQNARSLFIDIDRNSGNMDLEMVEPNLQYQSLKGRLFVVPIHFAGIAVDMKRLHQMTHASNVIVIEDAAHALGSLYPSGEKVGCCKYSDLTIFSFHPAKHITTGEGGMITTNDPEIYRKLQIIRNSGIVREEKDLKVHMQAPWYYEVQELSTNNNFTEFQAALGLSQLAKLDSWIQKRRSLVQRYRKNLSHLPTIHLFDASYDANTAYHLMVAQINFDTHQTDRTKIMEKLKEQGIGTQYHYIPLYRHPCYRSKMGEIEEYFPEMELYYRTAISLPLFPALSENEVDQICSDLKSSLSIS